MRLATWAVTCNRVPFANERELQRFIIRNAEELFGLRVFASTDRGGRPINKIDIVAIDGSNRLHIIECKHDSINSGTLLQLQTYAEAINDNWTVVEKRASESRAVSTTLRQPDSAFTVASPSS
jgi:RecB family endonuclease NucS